MKDISLVLQAIILVEWRTGYARTLVWCGSCTRAPRDSCGQGFLSECLDTDQQGGVSLHPAPYTLQPTPYTLHPTPYTAHPTPYTLHCPGGLDCPVRLGQLLVGNLHSNHASSA